MTGLKNNFTDQLKFVEQEIVLEKQIINNFTLKSNSLGSGKSIYKKIDKSNLYELANDYFSNQNLAIKNEHLKSLWGLTTKLDLLKKSINSFLPVSLEGLVTYKEVGLTPGAKLKIWLPLALILALFLTLLRNFCKFKMGRSNI